MFARLAAPKADQHRSASAARFRRRAFTLVELLVVITIIGILAGLATAGAFAALKAARQAAIRAEMVNLASAIEQFKNEHGNVYPPSFLDSNFYTRPSDNAILRYLAKAFPKCNPQVEITYIPRGDGTATGTLPMSGAQALVFWLTSISSDASRPLSAPTLDRKSYFDFDKSRLKSATSAKGGWVLIPNGANNPPTPQYTPQVYVPSSGAGAPYVYFDSHSYFSHTWMSGTTSFQNGNATLTSAGYCVPYLWDEAESDGNPGITPADADKDANGQTTDLEYQNLCANPKSFQIISAGLDGEFGDTSVTTPKINVFYYRSTSGTPPKHVNGLNVKTFPSGTGYSSAEDDNIVNFSDRALGDAKP